jgi:hypothetical protein
MMMQWSTFLRRYQFFRQNIEPSIQMLQCPWWMLGWSWNKQHGEFQGAWHAYVTAQDVFVKIGITNSHHGLRAACRSIEAIELLIESGEQKHWKKHLARLIPIKAEGRTEDSDASLDISDEPPAEAREEERWYLFDVQVNIQYASSS